MPFGIPSDLFNGGFGLPAKDEADNTYNCTLCQHNSCYTCEYKKRCVDEDRGVGCVCDDCFNGSKFKSI